MVVGRGSADLSAARKGDLRADRHGREEIRRGGRTGRRRVAGLLALRRGRCRAERHGAWSLALSLQIMRTNLQRSDRNAAARAAQEGALAFIRGILGRRRDGGEICAALRHHEYDPPSDGGTGSSTPRGRTPKRCAGSWRRTKPISFKAGKGSGMIRPPKRHSAKANRCRVSKDPVPTQAAADRSINSMRILKRRKCPR